MEFDDDVANLEIRISDVSAVDSDGVSINQHGLNFSKDHPRTHIITGLKPARQYTIDISDVRITDRGTIPIARFTTQAPTSDPSNLVIVGVRGRTPAAAIPATANVVINCGNIIPTQSLFESLVHRAATDGADADTVDRRLRQLYRDTLMEPGLRAQMATHSNLVVWGASESLTWTGADALLTPSMPYAWRIAHQVYRDYFRSLWDNDDSIYMQQMPHPDKPHETAFVTIGDTVIVLLDTHGNTLQCESQTATTSASVASTLVPPPEFRFHSEHPILGNTERRTIKKLRDLTNKNFIFVSDVPFIDTGVAVIGGAQPSDCTPLDQWPSSDIGLYELFMFAYALRLTGACGDVVLLSGTAHCGQKTIIGRNKFSIQHLSVNSGDHDCDRHTPLMSHCHQYQSWCITSDGPVSGTAYAIITLAPATDGDHHHHSVNSGRLVSSVPNATAPLMMTGGSAPVAPVSGTIDATTTLAPMVDMTTPINTAPKPDQPSPIQTSTAGVNDGDALDIEREYQRIMTDLKDLADVHIHDDSSSVSFMDPDVVTDPGTQPAIVYNELCLV